MAVAKTEALAVADSWRQQQEGIRWAQTTINLGSGGRAAMLVGRQWRNARTAALLGQEARGERRRAVVLVGRRRGIGGGEE
jgi:hypothetical protein